MKPSKFFFILLPLIHINPALANQDIIVDKSLSPNVIVTTDEKSKKEIVNINSADNNNISLNFYEKFDVSKNGIIINNKQAQADIIINEVTGDKITFINGNISVDGKKSHVIIANPNGVECYTCAGSRLTDLTLISGQTNKDNKTQFILSDKNYVSIHNVGYLSSKNLNIISNEVFIGGTLSKHISTINIFNGMSYYNLLGENVFDRKGRVSIFDSFKHNLERVNIYKNENIYNNIYLDEKIYKLNSEIDKTDKKINLLNNKVFINNKPINKRDIDLY